MPRRWRSVALATMVALGGCPERTAPTPVTRTPDASSSGAAPAAAGTGFVRCATVDGELHESAEAVRLGGLALQRSGRTLLARGGGNGTAATARRWRLGAVGDTKEALPRTLEGLDRTLRALVDARVDAIVVLGGIAPTFEGIRRVLRRLASGAIPLLALPGDRESQAGFSAAVENLPAGSAVDLTAVRFVALPGLSIAAVPGYHLPHHLLAAEQGCSYTATELLAIGRAARRLPAPRLLLAHGPPHGRGVDAIDRAFGEINAGDPDLARLIDQTPFQLGLFAHVHESGGRATTVGGDPVPEERWSPTLLLNVGIADAVPHEALAGGWRGPQAAVVEIERGRARYRMLTPSR